MRQKTSSNLLEFNPLQKRFSPSSSKAYYDCASEEEEDDNDDNDDNDHSDTSLHLGYVTDLSFKFSF